MKEEPEKPDLREDWRERLNGLFEKLGVPHLPEQREEYEKEVVHEAVTDRLARYDSPSERPRSKRSRLYGWNKLMGGR